MCCNPIPYYICYEMVIKCLVAWPSRIVTSHNRRHVHDVLPLETRLETRCSEENTQTGLQE